MTHIMRWIPSVWETNAFLVGSFKRVNSEKMSVKGCYILLHSSWHKLQGAMVVYKRVLSGDTAISRKIISRAGIRTGTWRLEMSVPVFSR